MNFSHAKAVLWLSALPVELTLPENKAKMRVCESGMDQQHCFWKPIPHDVFEMVADIKRDQRQGHPFDVLSILPMEG
jgi:hypothetical protein